jgi:AraC-like DNA-binding protein
VTSEPSGRGRPGGAAPLESAVPEARDAALIAGPSGADGGHRVGVLAELPALLLELGVVPGAVLAAAGVAPKLLRDPERRIPFAQAGRLLEEAVAATARPQLGLLLGLRGGPHSLGLVGRLMATAPGVQDAILDLCMNQVRFIRGAVTYLVVQEGIGLWGYSVQPPAPAGLAVMLDVAIGVGVATLRALAGGVAEAAHFAHAAPADSGAFRQALGIPCVFNADQTCLVLAPAVLAAPTCNPDPVLRRLLQRDVAAYWAREQPSTAERTRRILAAQLLAGAPTRERVAAELGIAPRTLNRRLEAEGTQFRAVRDEARHALACQLLGATRMSVTEIGTVLGYASPPNFVRAFRRATGQPPSLWRRGQIRMDAV